VLLVDATKEIAVNGKERDLIPGDIGDYTRTQIGRMKNVSGIIDALRSLPQKERPAFCNADASEVSQAVQLLKRLVIQEVPRSHLINVKIESDDPRFLGDALNAVVDGFIHRLHQERERQNDKRIEYLRSERARLLERLQQEHQKLLADAQGFESKAFLHENYSVHLNKVEQIQKLFLEADAERILRETALAKAQADLKAIQQLSLQPYADERVADNFGINRIEQYTYEQLQQMRVTVDGLTSGNQDRRYVEERMSAMNRYLDEYKVRVNEATMRNLEQKRAYDLQAEVLRAESALAAARSRAVELGSILSAAATQASATSEAIFNASSAAYSIRELRERLAAINNRIDDCQLEAKASVKLVVDTRAVNPTVPVSSPRAKAFAGGFGVAYGCAMLCCLAVEFLDGRLRSRKDVSAALGGDAPEPVLDFKGFFGAKDGGDDLVFPKIMPAVRSLAARLERDRMAHGSKVVLLMGAHRCTGASFIAHYLARTLLSYSERVLLIQTSVNPSPLADKNSETNVEIESPLYTERILPTGKGAAQELAARIRAARENHNFIIVDADPVVVEPFTRFAMLHSDAVIVTARAGVTIFQQLATALDEVRRQPVGAFTALLNFAPDVSSVGVQHRIQIGIRSLSVMKRRFHFWLVRRRP
jgi:capsular polysaccharide biosynthesis protein